MAQLKQPWTLADIVARLGGELLGDGNVPVRQIAPLDSAEPDTISFLSSDAYLAKLSATRAGALVLGETARALTALPRIVVSNPYAYFVRVAALLNPPAAVSPGVHATASVHPTAVIANSAQVCEFVSVGAGARLGERVFVGPGCRIGAGVVIGEASRLHANVTIYDRCGIGRRAVLNAGCVIGADGFGGALEDGKWLKMPHVGRVLIGDDVEVGANTTIDRGAMSDTVIEDGVKLDNQIQVGHNVRIGPDTSVAGCVGIAGSAQIGARCVIGGGAIILGHLEICDDAQISAGTVITRSIKRPGRYSGIFPFDAHRRWLSLAVQIRKLGRRGQNADEPSKHSSVSDELRKRS